MSTLRKIHRQSSDICSTCFKTWPCPTVVGQANVDVVVNLPIAALGKLSKKQRAAVLKGVAKILEAR